MAREIRGAGQVSRLGELRDASMPEDVGAEGLDLMRWQILAADRNIRGRINVPLLVAPREEAAQRAALLLHGLAFDGAQPSALVACACCGRDAA
jgi:hypothetical protein